MLKIVALQVGCCYTAMRSRQLAIFFSLFSYPELHGTKNENCAHAPLLKMPCRKLREKLLEGVIYCVVALPVSVNRCDK